MLRFERISNYYGDYNDDEESSIDTSCNVYGIDLHGMLVTYVPENITDDDYSSSEDIYSNLDQIEEDRGYTNIIAVILEIDSYGGSPVAVEELANKIKEMKIPVIAIIREGGASGAYWVASAADRIFASKLSDIGSIGVTMSYLDDSKLNEKEGYTWNSLSTGKFKDSGSMEKPLTQDERALFERDLKTTYEDFIKTVSENRNMSLEKVRSLADGSTMLGGMALKEDLIDQIGYYDEVKDYIKEKYNVDPVICW